MRKINDLIFLLGAGASVPVNIPDLKKFKDEFVTYCKKNQTLYTALKVVLDYDRRQDLEELLINLYSTTHLNRSIEAKLIIDDLADTLQEGLKLPGKIKLKQQLIGGCTSKIKAASSRLANKFEKLEAHLLDFINKRCLAFSKKKAKEIYEPILRLSKNNKIRIFTTNYDPVIEEVCRSCSDLRNKYWDGFVYDDVERLQIWDCELKGFGQKSIDIYKLHGSVTWYRNKDTTKIVQLPAKIGSDAEFQNGSRIFVSLLDIVCVTSMYVVLF